MDHYQTLGVQKDATNEQIKAAYRRLARKFHPDVSKEPDAADKIKSVNEAYAVIGDEDKRRAYDRRGQRANTVHEDFAEGDFFAGGLHDLFDSLFSRGHRTPSYALLLTLEQIYKGGKLNLHVDGTDYQVDLPPGVREGEMVASVDGRLHFHVQYAEHDQFQVHGDHVLGTIQIEPWDAALGGSHFVETLGGKVQAAFPAGLQAGQRIRLTGKGLPRTARHPAGDHWVQVALHVPQPTTAAQKKAYGALRDSFKKK